MLNKDALRIKRRCPARTDTFGPCPQDCGCHGTGLVPDDVDTTGMVYMAGAKSLPEFLSRILGVMEHEHMDAAKATLTGDLERAVIHAARRSGMAEIAAALQHYTWQAPAPYVQRRARA